MSAQPPTPNPNVRFHDLDALRAFAMLLGLVLHGLLSFMPLPASPVQDIHQTRELGGLIVSTIHGFRMPLFFMLSGFFTMMLWKKRGTRRLVSNRVLRILVPLIIGTLILYPLLGGIKQWGFAKRVEIIKMRFGSSIAPAQITNIWEAAKYGDVRRMEHFLRDTMQDPNSRDAMGISLLSWAALGGHPDVVSLLIENGAEVNSRDSEKRIALHSAALFGRKDVVDRLIAAGAEVNAVDAANDTPLNYSFAGMGKVLMITASTGLVVDLAEVKEGRQACRQAIREAGGKRFKNLMTKGYERRQTTWDKFRDHYRFIANLPIFHHLWFLHYLIWLTIFFLLFTGANKILKIPQIPDAFVRAPCCLVGLIPLTAASQSIMREEFGADTSTGLLIWPPIFLYYSIFFFYGSLAYGRESFLKSKPFSWIVCFLGALAAGLVALLMAGKLDAHLYERIIRPLCAAFYVWLTSFGLVSLFRQFLGHESRRIRWLSDSAYWLYITHFPLIMGLQIIVSDWDFPWPLKFLFVLSVATGILLILYQGVVRYTCIGTLLNGKKVRPK